jgi:Lon-like ATP-dependent protease
LTRYDCYLRFFFGTDMCCRYTGMNLILDLGKDTFSEPAPAPAKLTDAKDTDQAKSVEAQDPPANEPASPEPKIQRNLSSKDSDDAGPLKVPDLVHIRINPDNLKIMLGLRFIRRIEYICMRPAGVSTGLGYLGNGSGEVMPVEVMVCFFFVFLVMCPGLPVLM